MKKTMNNLDSLISRAITETLEEKAKHITTKLNELGGMEDGHPKFGKMNFASMSDEEIDDLMSSDMDDEYMDYDGDDASTLPGTNYGDDDEFEMDDEDYFGDDYETDLLEGDEMCEQCGKPIAMEGEMYEEGETCECGSKQNLYMSTKFNPAGSEFDYVQEEEDVEFEDEEEVEDEESCKYHMDNFGPEDDRTRKFCGTDKMGLDKYKFSMNEKLHGGQKKLDKNHNGKIDSEDFKMLRKDVNEKLHGGQKKLDKNHNGRIDAEDFKRLRMKKHMEESTMIDEDFGDGEFSTKVPYRYIWNALNTQFPGGKNQKVNYVGSGEDVMSMETTWTGPNSEWIAVLDPHQGKKYGKLTVQIKSNNPKAKLVFDYVIKHFLRNAEKTDPKMGYTGYKWVISPLDMDGGDSTDYALKLLKYVKDNIKPGLSESKDEKFIQKATNKMEKKGTEGKFGSWCKRNGLASEDGEVTKECIDKAMKSDNPDVVKMANFAKNIKGFKGADHKKKKSVKLSESEMIDLIEKIIKEEEEKVKSNIKVGTTKGLEKYKQVHDKDGKENKDALEATAKKMKEYLKDGSKGEYETNPKIFPKGNGEIEKMKKKAYVPSGAVEEYTDNLTAAALENIDYDDIKPNEEWVSANIEGSSKTGNNPEWANTGESDVNKKRNKIRKDNMLAKIKRKAYNKSPQPVVNDTAGEDEGDKIMTKLESIDEKQKQKINEEFGRMKTLMGYTQKTQ